MVERIVLESSYKDVSEFVEPIVVRSNGRYRISFHPIVINNRNHPECTIKGKLVVEKKKKDEDWDDPLRVSNLRVSEHTEIIFSSEELSDFIQQLSSLYDSFDSSDAGNNGCYVQFDGSAESVKKFFKSNYTLEYRWKSEKDRQELITIFSEAICDDDRDHGLLVKLASITNLKSPQSINYILEALSASQDFKDGLDSVNIDLTTKLRSIINISQLKKTQLVIENHLTCSKEKEWQKFFENNKWVLEQLYSTKYCFFLREAATGNPDTSGKGSNTVDFAFKHGLSHEISIVEIKPPTVPLLANDEEYRNGIFKINPEIIYAISQLLQNRYNLFTNYYQKISDLDEKDRYRVFDPLCILLVGNYKESLSDSSEKRKKDKQRTFDLFRRSLHGIQLVTYDELLSRLDATLELISHSDLSKSVQGNENYHVKVDNDE